MNKPFLVLVCCISFNLTFGQNETYKTAKWRYFLHAIDFQQTWNEEMTYSKDTTINNETWQEFSIKRKVQQYPNGQYLYTEENEKLLQWVGDSVYYLPNGSSNKFLLFNFNAQAGDSWEFAPKSNGTGNCPNFNVYFVDSTGTDMINGKPVKWTMGHNNFNSFWQLDTGKIYQNIGMPINIFEPYYNTNCVVHPPVYTLSCYEDTVIGTYTLNSVRCSLYGTLSIAIKENNRYKIYPNPAKEQLNVFSSIPIKNVQIVDLSGKTILETQTENVLEISIDLLDVKSGLYGLLINNVFVQKLIIE